MKRIKQYSQIAVRLLLELILRGGRASPRRMYEAVGSNFRLTRRERRRLDERRGGKEPLGEACQGCTPAPLHERPRGHRG